MKDLLQSRTLIYNVMLYARINFLGQYKHGKATLL